MNSFDMKRCVMQKSKNCLTVKSAYWITWKRLYTVKPFSESPRTSIRFRYDPSYHTIKLHPSTSQTRVFSSNVTVCYKYWYQKISKITVFEWKWTILTLFQLLLTVFGVFEDFWRVLKFWKFFFDQKIGKFWKIFRGFFKKVYSYEWAHSR